MPILSNSVESFNDVIGYAAARFFKWEDSTGQFVGFIVAVYDHEDTRVIEFQQVTASADNLHVSNAIKSCGVKIQQRRCSKCGQFDSKTHGYVSRTAICKCGHKTSF